MTRGETSRLGAFRVHFLSATENDAWQRQNIRRDLKKKMEEESRAVNLALESRNSFILVCAVQFQSQ